MKRLLTITLAALLIAAVAAPALAWEFSMTGQWEYRLRYWARLGSTDLFGIQDVGNNLLGIPVGLAGPNIYNRGAVPAFYADNPTGRLVITRGGFSQSESDAFQDDSRIEINPVIHVNPAIRVFGRYNIGGIRHKYWQNAGPGPFAPAAPLVAPFERYATFRTSDNAYDTAAIGSWEMFRMTAQLPWGVLSLGQKDFPFGTGAILGYNTRSDAVVLVVPYGPFYFVLSVWLARGSFADGISHATVPDSATKKTTFNSLLFTYNNGPMSFGAGYLWFMHHLNHSEIANVFGANTAAVRGAMDIDFELWGAYLKYNNGRVFTNLEYDWATANLYWLANNGVGGGPPRHDEAYMWFSEAGAFAGPAKVSLLYAISSGRVLNNGNVTKNYRPMAINNQVLDGYQYLLFNTYGGGNNGGWDANDINLTPDEVGKMTDAFCFAGRVDYAVASNLNVYGTYMWAHRLERAGFFAGGRNYNGAPGNTTAAAAQAWKALNTGGVAAQLNPYPDDGFLGWEVNAGFDWKLLENFTWSMKYAYWQPGEWFDQAYQAIGMRGGAAVTDALVTGRAPIMGLWTNLVVNF
ncbi:MAG: hypothetical protein ACPL7J_02260 [Desulfomonilaceae bacterium]